MKQCMLQSLTASTEIGRVPRLQEILLRDKSLKKKMSKMCISKSQRKHYNETFFKVNGLTRGWCPTLLPLQNVPLKSNIRERDLL